MLIAELVTMGRFTSAIDSYAAELSLTGVAAVRLVNAQPVKLHDTHAILESDEPGPTSVLPGTRLPRPDEPDPPGHCPCDRRR